MKDVKQYSLRFAGFSLWGSSIGETGGWFRLLGYGLTFKHESEGLLFSERNGYRKYLKVGEWIVKPLTP